MVFCLLALFFLFSHLFSFPCLLLEVSYPWASSRTLSLSVSTSSPTPARARCCSVLPMPCWRGFTPNCSSSESRSGRPPLSALLRSVIKMAAYLRPVSRPWRSSSSSRRCTVGRSTFWCCTVLCRGHPGVTITPKKSATATACSHSHPAARTSSRCLLERRFGLCGRSTTARKLYDLQFIAAMKTMSTWSGCTSCCFSDVWRRRRRTSASLWCTRTLTWKSSCRLRGSQGARVPLC